MDKLMEEKELKKFLLAQIEEINRYKWLESEKRCYDIGFQQAAIEWISQHSATFKENWVSRKSDNIKNPKYNVNIEQDQWINTRATKKAK